MHKFLFSLLVCTALSAGAYSSSVDDRGDTPGGSPSGRDNTGCIATNAVKGLNIASGASDKDDIDKMYLIYEDYTYRYYLSCARGSVMLWPYKRVNGRYENSHVGVGGNRHYGIKPFSEVANLQMLTGKQKTEAKEACSYYNINNYGYDFYSYAEFTPGCGFIAWFKTETEDARYVRIRSTNYTLDDRGSLSSVSIEYQLF